MSGTEEAKKERRAMTTEARLKAAVKKLSTEQLIKLDKAIKARRI